MAAEDEHGDDIDVTKGLHDISSEREETAGSIKALLRESVLQSRGDAKDDGLESKYIYVDFGDDGPEEIYA